MQRSCRERGKAAVNSGAAQLPVAQCSCAAGPQVGLFGRSQARRRRGHLPAPQRSLHTAVLGPASCLRSGHGATSERGWLQNCRPLSRAARAYAPSPGTSGVYWASTEAGQGKARGANGSAVCVVLKLRVLFADCPAVLPLRHAGTRRTGASRTSRTGCHTSRAGSWPQACLPLCLQHCPAVAWLTSLGQ